jgi:hypothetical protein
LRIPCSPRRPERAQSTLEFVGTLPLLAVGAACCLQAILVALALVFAQTAADRAARGDTTASALASVPSGWRRRAVISTDGPRVRVRLRPPALLPGAGRLLAVEASSSKVDS